MKKAVGHLIPFMEKEREKKFAELGIADDDINVSISDQSTHSLCHLRVDKQPFCREEKC